MMCSRKFAGLLLAAAMVAAFSFAQKPAKAQVVVYESFAPVTTTYYAPAVVSPAPVTTYYAPTPVYAGYAAPAPVTYGASFAPYPAVAPIGHGVISPRNGLEIEYKFRNGLWYMDIDD